MVAEIGAVNNNNNNKKISMFFQYENYKQYLFPL